MPTGDEVHPEGPRGIPIGRTGRIAVLRSGSSRPTGGGEGCEVSLSHPVIRAEPHRSGCWAFATGGPGSFSLRDLESSTLGCQQVAELLSLEEALLRIVMIAELKGNRAGARKKFPRRWKSAGELNFEEMRRPQTCHCGSVLPGAPPPPRDLWAPTESTVLDLRDYRKNR